MTGKNVGRRELITDLSERQLSEAEIQALSLGLKFNSGVNGKGFMEYLRKNYKWSDSDIDKGFKQGITVCYQALASEMKINYPEAK